MVYDTRDDGSMFEFGPSPEGLYYDDFLKSISIKLGINTINQGNFERVLQLNNKTNQLGAVVLSGSKNETPLNVEYFDDSYSVLIEGVLDDVSVPADYNPHIIKDFKHISELTDSSKIMNFR